MALELAGGRANNRGPTRGSRKGRPNKRPKELREMVATFVAIKMSDVPTLYARIARNNPAEALRVLLAMMEFALPKLARLEHTGEGGGPIQHSHAERAARIAGILGRADPGGTRLALVSRLTEGNDRPSGPGAGAAG